MKCYTPALLAAIAVAPFVAAAPQAKEVRMTESQTFEPKTITVKTGDTVVWKNVSDMTHSVTDVSQSGRFGCGCRNTSECEGIRFRPDSAKQGILPHIHCSRDL